MLRKLVREKLYIAGCVAFNTAHDIADIVGKLKDLPAKVSSIVEWARGIDEWAVEVDNILEEKDIGKLQKREIVELVDKAIDQYDFSEVTSDFVTEDDVRTIVRQELKDIFARLESLS